jgi:hypothetical protein
MKIVGLYPLCSPSIVYLVISLFGIFYLGLMNIDSVNAYNMFGVEFETSFLYMIFIVKFLFIIFWTWVLNIICRAGYSYVSWIIVLFPFLLLFFLVLFMRV